MAKIDVIVRTKAWRAMGKVQARARAAVEATLREVGTPVAGAGATIVLASDGMVRKLNAQYRKKDQETNVLSFPAGATGATDGFLGDVVLAHGVCAREAMAEGKSLANHMNHLVVHGVLHLLGYDHESDADADVMEACEIRILASLGIADPYSGVGEGASE